MSYLWLVFALLSAITAALVSIFGKIGLQSVEANTATAVRAVIMAVFLVAVVAFQGNIGKIPSLFEDKKNAAVHRAERSRRCRFLVVLFLGFKAR